MASGTILGSTGNQYIDSKIEWSSTVIINSSNSSEVTATLYYKRNNSGFTTSGTGTFSITIDGSTKTATKTMSIDENAWVSAMTYTKTVIHNDYGKKLVKFSATGSIPSTTLSSTTCSGSGSLDEIPRASEITRIGDITLGGACDVTWTPKSSSFSFKVDFVLGTWKGSTGMVAPQSQSQFTFRGYAIPLDVAKQLPNTTSGTMTATLYTYAYQDGTAYQIGTAHSKTFKVTIPNNDSTKPAVSMVSESVSTLPSAFSGLYIQGKSRAKVTFTGEGKYGATIASYGLTVLGKGYADPFQTELLSTSGTVRLEGRAMDSRGFVTSVNHDIKVIPYSKPKLTPASEETAIVCARCDSSGNLTESGTFLKIKVGRAYSDVEQKNSCTLRYRYKVGGSSTFSPYTTLSTGTDVDITLGNVVSSTKTSYAVELSAVDDIGEEATITFDIPTEDVDFHLRDGGKGAAFGKYAERENAVEIAPDWDMYYRGKLLDESLCKDTGWVALTQSGNASTPSTVTRGGAGCFYRVINGNHVFVRFNCALTYNGSSVNINSETIPSQYRPKNNAMALLPVNDRCIARASVASDGYIYVNYVQNMATASTTTSYSVAWIDGYIDYFI